MAIHRVIGPFLFCLFFSACTSGLKSGAAFHFSDADLSGPGIDHAAYGSNAIPLWSPLTAPELRALQDRDKAAAGDADALLALAILASGDRRRPEDYAAIRASIAAFAARLRPELDAEKSPWQKGFKLHRAMHAAFFPAAQGADNPVGYDWAQSRLTGIFTEKKYNCISSALLYLVLAREFGFRVQGVLLPSHAFVQLTLPDGKIIEVETTTPSGYDWIHDEAFYKKRAGAWFSARGLPASTYKDYQARRILEPLQLVAHNMGNQHTAPKVMSAPDRCRLLEARAWTYPADREGQVNRIAFFASEFKFLSGKGEWAVLERMYRTVAPSFPALRKKWEADSALANHVAWQAFCNASVLHELGRIPEAFPWIDSSLAWLSMDAADGAILKSNNVARIGRMARDLGERKEFSAAEGYLLRYPGLLREDKNLRAQMTWLYQAWAMQACERKEWEAAAALFGKSLEYAAKEYRKPIRDNVAVAYLNIAAQHQNDGDWPKAREVLRKCLDKVPEAKKCQTWMEELVAQHNLDD
jgi:hypothetical protein